MTHVEFKDIEGTRVVAPKKDITLMGTEKFLTVITTEAGTSVVSQATFNQVRRELLEPESPLNGVGMDKLSEL